MPRYKLAFLLLFLYLLLIYPLSGMLPDWASFENGPLENAQVAVLVGGALLCAYFSRRTAGSHTHGMWLPSAGIFLILAFRELSWGRVFLVKGYTEIGEPILPGSSEMPFHTAIHVGVGIAAILCLYFLVSGDPPPLGAARAHRDLHRPQYARRSSRHVPHHAGSAHRRAGRAPHVPHLLPHRVVLLSED